MHNLKTEHNLRMITYIYHFIKDWIHVSRICLHRSEFVHPLKNAFMSNLKTTDNDDLHGRIENDALQ